MAWFRRWIVDVLPIEVVYRLLERECSNDASHCRCEEFDDVAILANAVRRSSSSARAVPVDSVCHPNLDTDCHVVELLAMTIIHFGRVREHDLFRQRDHIDGPSPPQDCKQRPWELHLTPVLHRRAWRARARGSFSGARQGRGREDFHRLRRAALLASFAGTQ